MRTRTRFCVWAVCAPLLLGACAKTLTPKVMVAPDIIERHDARAPLKTSHLSLALTSDLTVFEPLLLEELARALPFEQKEWTRAANNGFAEVDTRMRAQVQDAKLEMDGEALRVAAKVNYFGQFRARIKTPLGRVWLTQGTDWGTRDAPGSVTVTVRIEPKINQALKLTTKSSLVAIAFEAPKGDDLCSSGAFRVCVSRERAAEAIHPEVEKILRKEAPRALNALDRVVSREVGLARVIGPVVEGLGAPQRTVLGSYLALTPKAVALSAPEGEGSVASMNLELWVEPSFTSATEVVSVATPTFQAATKEPSELHFDLLVPFDQLSSAYTEAAARVTKARATIRRISVIGASDKAPALVLALDLSRGEREATVYATATPINVQGVLSLQDVVFAADSLELIRDMRANAEELSAGLMRECIVSLAPLLGDHVGAIRARLAAPLLLFGALDLKPETPGFEDGLSFDGQALRVRANVLVTAQVKR